MNSNRTQHTRNQPETDNTTRHNTTRNDTTQHTTPQNKPTHNPTQHPTKTNRQASTKTNKRRIKIGVKNYCSVTVRVKDTEHLTTDLEIEQYRITKHIKTQRTIDALAYIHDYIANINPTTKGLVKLLSLIEKEIKKGSKYGDDMNSSRRQHNRNQPETDNTAQQNPAQQNPRKKPP